MKNFRLFLTVSLSFCLVNFNFASGNDSHNDIIVFDLNSSCVEKYLYEVHNDFIVDDDHTAYHVHLNNETVLVLKVMASEPALDDVNTQLSLFYNCQSVKGIQPKFVINVNNGSIPTYVKDNDKYYRVSYSEFNVDNDAFFSSFGPPHHSLVYEYGNDYDPLETLRPAALDNLDYDTRNYNYTMDSDREEYNFVYYEIYRNVCVNRPYSLLTPLSELGEDNPYKYEDGENTAKGAGGSGKQIYRSCQHPVEVTHIQGVGTTKKEYEEDGNIYSSTLISIDGVPLETYMETHKFHHENEDMMKSADLAEGISWEYKLKDVPTPKAYQPQFIAGNPSGADSNTRMAGNTAKSPTPITLTVPTIDGDKHVVTEGETLYSISQKYKVSVLDIKVDNQLVENTIEIGQQLVIGKK